MAKPRKALLWLLVPVFSVLAVGSAWATVHFLPRSSSQTTSTSPECLQLQQFVMREELNGKSLWTQYHSNVLQYKAGISDVRESPAEHVARAIQNKGFKPVWKDPLVSKFHEFEEFRDHQIGGAIVVTAQPGLPVAELAEKGIPILDCTGAFKGISGVEQL